MKKVMMLVLLFSLGLGLIVACQAASPQEALPEEYAGLENPYAGDTDAAVAGMDIFAVNCERCHDPEARGEGSAPDLVASTDEHAADY
jgi:mono/diheme cytochrome c family protein